jgi:lipoate-protein ligase A
MKTIDVPSHDPYFNLALEEYLLKEYPGSEDLLFFWRSSPSLVIGRNQNPYNEIQLATAFEKVVPVLRRISGGGTVYHDLGNLNFTFIVSKPKERIRNYRFFLDPLVEVLRNTGLDVRFVSPSHLYLKDQKISGNAQSFHKQRMIHHGTLLFDTDLNAMDALLKASPRVSTNTVDSVRATTTNIGPALSIHADIESFAAYLRSELLFGQPHEHIVLSDSQTKRIRELATTKYASFEWTYGQTPSFDLDVHLEGRSRHLHIQHGRIESSTWRSDQLQGRPFTPDSIESMLLDSDDKSTILARLFDDTNTSG